MHSEGLIVPTFLHSCCLFPLAEQEKTHAVGFFHLKHFTRGEFCRTELKQMSLCFTTPASECYLREHSLLRPKSYILPICLLACSLVAKTGSFCLKIPLFSSGRAMSLTCQLEVSPLFFSLNSQSERSEVRVISDTVTSQGS